MRNRFFKILLIILTFVLLFSYAVFADVVEGYTTVAGTFDNIPNGIFTKASVQSLIIKNEPLAEGKISAEFSSNVKQSLYPVGIVFAGNGILDYRNISGINICYLRVYFKGADIVLERSDNGSDTLVKSASVDTSVFDSDTVKLSVSFSLDGKVEAFVNDRKVISAQLGPKLIYGGEYGICAGGDGIALEITNIMTTSLFHTEHLAGEITPEIRANCINDGKKEHSVCNVCGELIYQKDGVWTATTEAELVIPKDSNNHIDSEESLEWICDKAKHTKICRCGEVLVSEDHDIPKDALTGKCTVCSYNKIHICDDFTKIHATPGNCVTRGKIEHYRCNDCLKLYIRSGNSYIEKTEVELEGEIVPENHIDSVETLKWTYDDSKHYKICRCGKVLSSGKHSISASALQGKCSTCDYERGHTCTYTEIPETPASCMTKGRKAHYKCEACNKLYIKNGESYIRVYASDLDTPKDRSNHVDSVDALPWDFDENIHKKTCRCGKILFSEAHDISPDSVLGACSICSYKSSHICEYIYVSPKAADCTTDGIKEHYKCLVCGKICLAYGDKYVEISIEDVTVKASHKLEKIDAVIGSCITESCEEYYKCEVCERIFSDENGKNEIENIPKGEKDLSNHADSNNDGKCDLCLQGDNQSNESGVKREGRLGYYLLISVVIILFMLCLLLLIIINRLLKNKVK